MRTDRALLHDILRKSTGFLRRIIVPVEGSPCRTYPLTATDSHLKTACGGSLLDTGGSNGIGGGRRAASTLGTERGLGHARQHGPPGCKKCFQRARHREEFAAL